MMFGLGRLIATVAPLRGGGPGLAAAEAVPRGRNLHSTRASCAVSARRGKGKGKVGRMPVAPPVRVVDQPREVLSPEEAALRQHENTPLYQRRHPDATPSVAEEWYRSTKRGDDLKTAEKRVAGVAFVSMLIGFLVVKATMMNLSDTLDEAGDDKSKAAPSRHPGGGGAAGKPWAERPPAPADSSAPGTSWSATGGGG